jgi:putative addiction module component (TIGR02574 family)
MGVQPSDLAGLSVEEKLDLISELWDSIEASAAAPALSEGQQQELTRRRTAGLADPSATDDWSSVREKLFRKQ